MNIDTLSKSDLQAYYSMASCGSFIDITLLDRWIIDGKATPYSRNKDENCILLYDVDVIHRSLGKSVFDVESSIRWFMAIDKKVNDSRIAHINLVSINKAFRLKGIGKSYSSISDAVFNDYGINKIEIDAAHKAVLFWLKMGYNFENDSDFWNRFADYCLYSGEDMEFDNYKDINQIPKSYFSEVEDNETYKMYKLL